MKALLILENNVVELARRDTKEKATISIDGLAHYIVQLLAEIQQNIYNKALDFRTENTREANHWEEFLRMLDETPGFISAHWDGTEETEEKIKEESKATIRCIPLDAVAEEGVCIFSGKPSKQRVLFARAY